MNGIKRKVFYSFHFDNDVFRVQQVRNMGVIEGNEPTTRPNPASQLAPERPLSQIPSLRTGTLQSGRW
jgi:hypothetical protein